MENSLIHTFPNQFFDSVGCWEIISVTRPVRGKEELDMRLLCSVIGFFHGRRIAALLINTSTYEPSQRSKTLPWEIYSMLTFDSLLRIESTICLTPSLVERSPWTLYVKLKPGDRIKVKEHSHACISPVEFLNCSLTSLTAVFKISNLRPMIYTFEPFSTKPSDNIRPIPVPPPVITTT